MNTPGKIFTASEIQTAFKLDSSSEVERLFDIIEQDFRSDWMKIDYVGPELGNHRILIFEKKCWNVFVTFMQGMGYSYSE